MTFRTIFASTTLALALAACGGSTTDGGAGLGGGAGQGGAGGSAGSGGSAGGPSCKSDGDCTAPALCQLCADGVTSSCATGKCVAGACEIVYPPCPDVDGGGVCPPDAPIGKSCAGNLHCTYGTETCCGHTYPSTVCDCTNGSFACYATDACMIPPDACEDAGPAPPQVPCGGFAGTPCPGSGQCVYPPNTCPDCAGYCECAVAIDCVPGTVFDASPSVCACVAVNAADGGAGQ